MDTNKEQSDKILTPAEVPEGVVISPDTYRMQRISLGQSRRRKWPVRNVNGQPSGALSTWKLRVFGRVSKSVEWRWKAFLELPRVKISADFPCVARWSWLGNVWEGVATGEIPDRAGGPMPGAKFVPAHGCDRGFNTNLPAADFLAEVAPAAITHDQEPITPNHGGPARLIIPQSYVWKSATWISGIELMDRDEAGFWECNGYYMHGDPWREERYSW